MLNKNLFYFFKRYRYLLVLILFLLPGIVFFQSCTSTEEANKTAGDGLDRTVLPIKAPPRPTSTELDVRNAKVPERFEVKAPKAHQT